MVFPGAEEVNFGFWNPGPAGDIPAHHLSSSCEPKSSTHALVVVSRRGAESGSRCDQGQVT